MGISCVTSTWKDGFSHAFSQRRPPTTAKPKIKPRRSRGSLCPLFDSSDNSYILYLHRSPFKDSGSIGSNFFSVIISDFIAYLRHIATHREVAIYYKSCIPFGFV